MVFSAAPFSAYAFSELPAAPLDSTAFEDFLAEVTAKRCWLLELDAFALASSGAVSAAFSAAAFSQVGFSDASAGVTGGVQTLRFSSQGYTSHADDSPASTHYDSRLKVEDIVLERRIVGRDGIGGLTRVFGQVSIDNSDGELDNLTRDYAVDGRRVRILIGRPDDALADYGLVFSGVVSTLPTIGQQRVVLQLSDGAAKLAQPVNDNVYAGTGDTEGGADVAGQHKPVAFGEALNVAAPLVDSTRLIYQAHDGTVSDVPAVYDRGILLTQGSDYSSSADLLANAPSAGEYRVYKAGGYFRLGSTPSGTVTCNVLGDASLSGYVETTGDIVLRLLAVQAALTSSEIDPASFSRLGTDAGAPVGIWSGLEVRNVDAMVDELLAGIGAFGGFSRHGAFTVGVIKAPAGIPAQTLTEAEIVELEQLPLPGPVNPRVWRARVAYQRNYTVQGDFAAAVTAARRTFAAQPARYSTVDDSTVKSRYLLAVEFLQAGFYQDEADSDDEADRVFDLWSGPRRLFRVLTKLLALPRDIGQVVQLEHSRYGLSLGVPGRVLGHAVRGEAVELMVLT